MGAISSKTQQDLKIYLQHQYIINNYPSISHRTNNKKAIVHQIVTDSTQQAHKIRSDVNMYNHIGCGSISQILQYIPLESNKICSQQEYHYIVEEDLHEYNLREQFLARKYYKEKFSDHQLLQIVKMYLCALNVYHAKFSRRFPSGVLGLNAVTIDEEKSNQLRLTDPLLMTESINVTGLVIAKRNNQVKEQTRESNNKKYLNMSKSQAQSLELNSLIREAPERAELRKTKFNDMKTQLNELLADLYTIGIIILELHRMDMFDKNADRNNVGKEVESISNREIKKIVTLLTSGNPEQRGQVYELLKMAPQDSYRLERTFRNGRNTGINHSNPQKNAVGTTQANNLNQQNHHQLSIPPQKHEESFSFGVSKLQSLNQSGNISAKPSESFGISSSGAYQSQLNSHYHHTDIKIPASLQKPKTGTISNMSTDRTLIGINNYTSPLNIQKFTSEIASTTHTTSKPIVKFNNSSSSLNSSSFGSIPIFSSSTQNLTGVTNSSSNINAHYKPNFTSNNSTTNYISPSHTLLPSSNFYKPPRANSFLVGQQDRKPLFKDTDYSPFKKQQDLSPLSNKEHEYSSKVSYQGIGRTQNNAYKQIFDKYSGHIHYQTYSPGKNAQSKKVQQEMARLLKNSNYKNYGVTDFNAAKQHKTDYSHIGSTSAYHKIDSPISALQPSQISTFTQKQQTFSNNKPYQKTQKQQTESTSAYRPNKEVEQILKRLGIGSLLYGNEGQSTINDDRQMVKRQGSQKQNNHEKIHLAKQKKEHQQEDVFVHKVHYNIGGATNNNKAHNNNTGGDNKSQISPGKQSSKPYTSANDSISEPKEESIHTRQTTPIRPTHKNKYNSTIVEVGDQDSQYSSSGVRNIENQASQVDLTSYQHVVEEYETGSRYQGYKKNGLRNGQGKFYYQDGGFYEGMWKDNKMDGWGRLFYQGGKLAYEGNWAQDQFHGEGKVFNDNPTPLDCGFDFTNFDLLQDFWLYYEGMLVKDTKEGRGRIRLTNDEVFEGDFHNDRIQGFGKFFMKDGNAIEGIWRDSKLIKIISS